MQDSNISGIFYTERLYPLQNRILNAISASCPSLYLTGGTALSRFYLGHRYSDDLDLFVNGSDVFPEIVETAVRTIQGVPDVEIKDSRNSLGTGYIRLDVVRNGVGLTIDIVNDIDYRLGFPKTLRGIKVDTLANIFTNKLSALIGRDELKDVVDIREICRCCHFDWGKALEASVSKEASVNEEYIDYRLFELQRFVSRHPDFLNSIAWIRKPDVEMFVSDLETIRRDALESMSNSLCNSPVPIRLDGLCSVVHHKDRSVASKNKGLER